jgi:hypothetical protein
LAPSASRDDNICQLPSRHNIDFGSAAIRRRQEGIAVICPDFETSRGKVVITV